ncbi:thiazole synthase [Mesoterricola silvestris]|uniref:Thiazole synthase n=1 Tax=Mesoterricola silvestris TaxID=2927979 RepID=A0AA48K9V0_9BACT|nr:thiazole synthase [Mesoterricola silvestris]BDU70868.1 thiazole synthase [Mesoterricola silvestris]
MLTIAGRTFQNRLILGTGKYKDFATMKACYEAGSVEMVTLAVRRFDLSAKGDDNILNWIPKGMALLPNTAGCYTREDALRVCRLAREALETDWVKLEVIGDPLSLYPDGEETLRAAEILVKEGFVVLPYINADPILAKKLCEAGCAAVMPLGSAIGSGLGVQNPYVIQILRDVVGGFGLPLIVDAGVGTASDAAVAMELGADAVLMNTAVAEAADPVKMARAMDFAVKAGRLAFEAGRMPRRLYASASSPVGGVVGKG